MLKASGVRILSIDLAYKSYEAFGIVLFFREEGGNLHAKFLSPSDVGLTGEPEPIRCAESLWAYCIDKVSVLILDGPQGWKDPDNGLEHSRIAERELNTPAKVGLPPDGVKPKNYLHFVQFSCGVFSALRAFGGCLAEEPTPLAGTGLLVLESFPLSAWKSLGIKPLPGKQKTKEAVCLRYARHLQDAFGIAMAQRPTHDQLQATVAGLAAVAVACDDRDGYVAVGAAPREVEGFMREGYIFNPLDKN